MSKYCCWWSRSYLQRIISLTLQYFGCFYFASPHLFLGFDHNKFWKIARFKDFAKFANRILIIYRMMENIYLLTHQESFCPDSPISWPSNCCLLSKKLTWLTWLLDCVVGLCLLSHGERQLHVWLLAGPGHNWSSDRTQTLTARQSDRLQGWSCRCLQQQYFSWKTPRYSNTPLRTSWDWNPF